MNAADLVNEIVSRLSTSTRVLFTGVDNTPASQDDKPSPHSSVDDNYARLSRAYPPSAAYSVVGVANTNSMEPYFDDNCDIVLEEITPSRLDAQPLVAGDIIVYPYGKIRIIHRLRTKTPSGWIIEGDNNYLPDMKIVQDEEITHRVVAIAYGRARRPGD